MPRNQKNSRRVADVSFRKNNGEHDKFTQHVADKQMEENNSNNHDNNRNSSYKKIPKSRSYSEQGYGHGSSSGSSSQRSDNLRRESSSHKPESFGHEPSRRLESGRQDTSKRPESLGHELSPQKPASVRGETSRETNGKSKIGNYNSKDKKPSQSRVHKQDSVSMVNETQNKISSEEDPDLYGEKCTMDRKQKYATWDRSVQKKRAKQQAQQQNQQQRSSMDDSGIGSRKGKSPRNDYQKMSQSISTDLATLRTKTKMLQSLSMYSNETGLYHSIPDPAAQSAQSNESQSQKDGQTLYTSTQNGYHEQSTAQSIPKVHQKHSHSVIGGSDKKYLYKQNSNGQKSESIPQQSSLPLNKETYIDIDSLINNDAQESYEDEDEFFPKLEGYRRHGLKMSFPSAPYKPIKHLTDKSICSACLGAIFFCFGALIVFLPVTALCLVLFPFCYLLKKMFSCCCCYGTKCDNGEPLSIKEKKWTQNLPKSTLIYQGLMIIEYGLTTARFRELINYRLIMAEDKNGNKLYPKLTKKVAKTCSGLVWVNDNDFLVNNHVFNIPSHVETMEDLQDYVSDMASRPLSMDHPLWEIQILTDFGDQRDSVLLLRVHPCVADGISLVQLLCKSIVDIESVTIAMPKFSSRRRCWNAVQAVLTGPLVFFKHNIFKRQDFNMLHGDHVHMSGKRVIAWSEPFAMEEAIRLTQVTRSTLNDILTSIVAGCLRNYLQANGIHNPYNMQCLVPVHFYTGSTPHQIANNDCLFLSVQIPTNTEGVIPRLWAMKNTMDEIGSLAMFSVTQGALNLSSAMFPECAVNSFWNSMYNKCTCVISNVPGPESSLRISTKQVKSVMCWMPPVKRVAIAITFFSYGEQLRMCVMTDRSVLPNPEMLTKDFIHGMQSLTDLLANRRTPGEQPNKRLDTSQLDCEIHAEQTVEQIEMRMALVQQELSDLKLQLEMDTHLRHGEAKLRRKIEQLKEQSRDLLVEMRQRKAAEMESAIILTDDDPEIEDDEDNVFRRPFRRRTLSIGSRMSTASASSTARPLAATTPTTPVDYNNDADAWSQASTRTDGISSTISGRHTYRRQQQQPRNEFEILEYAHSPSMERRFRTF